MAHLYNNSIIIIYTGWELDFAPYPDDPSAYVEDQAVRFHRPLEAKGDDDEGKDDKETVSRGPKPTDWRWGPGKIQLFLGYSIVLLLLISLSRA